MKLQKETQNDTALHGRWYGDACAAAYAMEIIGERWSLLIVRELMLGPRRFSQLRAELPGISAKILTERLGKLEEADVLFRRTLPPPAQTRVYELTEWGKSAEPIMRELGRWAVQSPGHDPTLPLSPVSFMLSLRAMFDEEASGKQPTNARFDFGSSFFDVMFREGVLTVRRADDMDEKEADIVFRAPSPNACLPVFYGDQSPGDEGIQLTAEGDEGRIRDFIALFGLPPKIA